MSTEVTEPNGADLEIPATILPEMTDRGRYPRSEDDDSGPIPRAVHRHSRADDSDVPWYSLMRMKLGDLVTIVTLVIALASMRFEISALKEQVIELRGDVKEALTAKAELQLIIARQSNDAVRLDKIEARQERDLENAQKAPARP